MQPVLLSQQQARERREAGSIMSVKRAHRKLAELRSNHTNEAGENTIECVDLTDSDFPWRGYLASRSDEMLSTIIDTGVVRFELRFVNSEDKNKKQSYRYWRFL